MNLTNIVDAVLSETRRPDQRERAIRAVRMIITQIHTSARFSQDITEDVVDVEPSNLLKLTLPRRFRDFEVIRPMTAHHVPIPLRNTLFGTLEKTSISEVNTAEGQKLTNVYYVAGSTVILRSEVLAPKWYMSYYTYPEVSNPNLETWAMEVNPELFILGATAMIYSMLAQDSLANAYKSEFGMALSQFISDKMGV